MRIFLKLIPSVLFVSSIFTAPAHPINLCYEGGWEESCPSMECCIAAPAETSENSTFIIQLPVLNTNPPFSNYAPPLKQLVLQTALPPSGVLLWIALKTSFP